MNPHGQPSLDVPQGAGWIAGVGGRTGILQPAGPMFFNVPDAGRTDLSKTLLLLLRYQFLNGPDLLGQPLVVDSTGSPFTLVPGSEARTPDILPGWRLYTAQWTFPTCPPNETVIIGAGTPQIPLLVDFVFIRTECVPEPSTFTLAGLCAVVLLGYAWRRQRAKAA
jgi:hypothetical protein